MCWYVGIVLKTNALREFGCSRLRINRTMLLISLIFNKKLYNYDFFTLYLSLDKFSLPSF